MPTVTIDGIEVALGEKERLNGIQAAARAGIEQSLARWPLCATTGWKAAISG